MEERKDILLKSAMAYGLAMGIFWVIKYLFFMYGGSGSWMNSFYMGLTFMVPYVAYKQTKQYKKDIGGKIGFFHAWQFGILVYFFAAMIVSLEHYVFYRYVAPPDFIANSLNQMVDVLKESQQLSSEVKEAMGDIHFTPIQMAIQGIFNNVFYGILFSIPVAALVCRNKNNKQ